MKVGSGRIEIDRNVKIEIVDDAPNGVFRESTFSIGSRPATRLPRFTEEELEAGLGKELHARIGRLFSDSEHTPSN